MHARPVRPNTAAPGDAGSSPVRPTREVSVKKLLWICPRCGGKNRLRFWKCRRCRAKVALQRRLDLALLWAGALR